MKAIAVVLCCLEQSDLQAREMKLPHRDLSVVSLRSQVTVFAPVHEEFARSISGCIHHFFCVCMCGVLFILYI
jgi:hypothetical protein